jgi:glycerol-3-phosphate dehydrogenase
LLPGLCFSRDQIVYAYSGIRQLPASDGNAPGLICRDHSAPVLEPQGNRPWPIVSLVGGKWTTFRGFAEEVADMLLGRLGASRRRSTRDLPIGGGRGFPADAASRSRWIEQAVRETGATAERAGVLLDRYGTTARAILAHEAARPAEPLADAPGYRLAEIDWLARNEQVVHLTDIVMRRTALAITGRLTRRDLERIADVAADALGWEPARRAGEIDATLTELAERHRLCL